MCIRDRSSTDVMTTSAKTPSIKSVSVRSERSLCAHNSIRPPRTTSPYSASLARKGRPVGRETEDGRRETKTSLLIPKSFHRRQARGLECGIEREEEAERDREQEREEEALGAHVERDPDRRRDDLREADAGQQAQGASEPREKERLGQELFEHLAAGRADRHLHADLTDALLQGRHLDVDVDDAASQDREEPGQPEDDVVGVPLLAALAHPGGDVIQPEVLLLAVVRLEEVREALRERGECVL